MRFRRPISLALLSLALLAPADAVADAADGESVRAAVATLERFAQDPFEQKERSRAIRRLGRIGGEDAAAALFAVFEDPFVHLHDHATSAWIAMLKGKRADPTRAFLIAKALPHRHAHVRRGAATALGVAGGPAVQPALEKRLTRERDPRVKTALVYAIGRLGLPSKEATARLVAKAEGPVLLALADVYRARGRRAARPLATPDLDPSSRDPLGRAADVLLDAAGGRLDAARVDAALKDEADAVRIALTEVVGDRAQATGIGDSALRRLLADPSWRVRAAAIHACRRQPNGRCVVWLIDRLDLESGRLRLDLLLALQAITGQTIDDDPELWRAWWKSNQSSFEPSQPAPPPRLPTAVETTTTRAFFRIPVHSTRLAFLIDCSGSMRDAADPALPDGPTKLDRARAELARTLAALDADASFDVFLYRFPSDFPPRPRMTRALGRLSPASRSTVKKAGRWLDRQEAKGWGAFYDALVGAIAEDVDTVYFLSDGRASRGTYDRDFRLLDEFERANRFRRVVVHTVLVGRAQADRAFLQDLAQRTGGLFADATAD